MSQPRILLFDSGMGGLTVARAVAKQMPEAHLIYSADNAGFPYGAWKEKPLVERIKTVMGRLIDRAKPDVVVLGCTHYPLLIEEIKKVAPWEANYIDPSAAIARRVADVVEETKLNGIDEKAPAHGTVLLTAARGESSETLVAYANMGFAKHEIVDLPV